MQVLFVQRPAVGGAQDHPHQKHLQRQQNGVFHKASGEVIKIPGKGYKDSRGGRGDLIANVKVMVPKKLTEEEKEIFSKLKEVSSFNPRNMY